MKHGKKFKSLSRTKSHRKALMGNLASELIKERKRAKKIRRANID
jgi:ribosomal protein L17